MGEIDWKQLIALSQKELSPKKKEKLYESIAWMDADDIEINFGDLKSLFLIAQDMMKFKADQVDTLTGQIDAMVQRETYNEKGDAIMMEQIVQQEEEIRANKDILDQLYRDIASLQEHKDKKLNFDKESTSSRDPLSEINDIKQLEMTISLKNEHLKKMLADLQTTEEENVKLREKLNNMREKLSEATTHISHMTDEVEKLKSQSSHLKGRITELEEQKNTSLQHSDGLKQDLREREAIKDATIEELKLNVDYWKDSSSQKQTKIDQMMEEMSALKTQLRCLKDDTYLAQTVKKYKHQIKNLQANLSEASQEIDNSANVIEKLKLENKDMKEAVKNYTSRSDTTSLPPYTQDLRMTKVKEKLQCKLADARDMIRSREQEIADLSGQIQIFHRDDGIKSLSDKLHQQKRQLKIRDEHIKSLVGEINSMNEAIDNLQLENVAMREKLNLQPEEEVSTVGILAKFSQMEKRAKIAERELSKLKESHLTLQLEAREGRRGRRRRQDELLSGLDGGGDAPSYLSLPQESISTIDAVGENNSIEMQNLIDENDGLRKGLHEILDFIKESVIAEKSTVEIGSKSLDNVTATLDARHAAGWLAPHLATAAQLQRALGARDALSAALGLLRRETYEVIEKLAKESQKTCDLEDKLLELQKYKVQLRVNTSEPSYEEIKNNKFDSWMTEDIFDKLNLEENNSLAVVKLKTVNKNYVLQLRDALTHFHNQFNSLYKQMTDLSVRMSEEQQKWGLLDEQYKAQIENLQSQVAAFDNEQNSDCSIGAVQFSKVILQRRCTYLEESFRNIRTMNENLKNEYLASEKDKLIKVGNYESQIQSLIIDITSYSDRLKNSVPIDFFLKQNIKYNELNMKYRNLLHTNMQCGDITQNKNDFNEALHNKLKAIKREKKQVAELLQSESRQNIDYALVEESPNKQNKNLPSKLATAVCKDSVVEQEVWQQTCDVAVQCEIDQHQEQVNQQIEDAAKYTQELEKKLFEFHERQKDFVDRAVSCISREEYNDLKSQLKERTDDNKTLKMEIAKVSTELEITTLQLHDFRQRQFCSDTEVSLLRHQVLDLQAHDPGAAVVARLGGEVLVSQLRAADMQRRLERSLCELRHEQRRRRQAEQRCISQNTSAQMHAAAYHFKLGFIKEVLQILREQYDGALPIVSLENYVIKLNEMTTKSQELEIVQKDLEGLKVTCQGKMDGYNKIISAAKCGLNENDCPHYIQFMLNKSVCAREVEHSRQQVQTLEASRAALASHCGHLERTLLTLSRAWTTKQQVELQLLDVTSLSPIHQHVSLHDETQQLLATSRTSPCLNGAEEGTEEGSMASPHCLNTQTVQIVNNERVSPHIMTHAIVQTEQILFESSCTQTENIIAERQREKDMIEINSLSLTLVEKEKELKHIVNKAEIEKLKWQREVEALTHRDNEKKQYIEKLVQQINNLNNQISHLQSVQMKLQQKIAAVKDAEKEKESIMQECREMLKKEREEYTSNAAASQKKIEELQNDIDKLIIESNELRGALLQPTNLKAMSEIVDKYTGKIGSLEDSCLKLQDTLDTCKSDLVWSQAETERWKTLSIERLNKLEKLNAKLEERHGLEIEWHRAENSHLLQQLHKSEHTLSELRQSFAHQRHDKLYSEKQLKIKIPLSESDLKLNDTSEVESPSRSVREALVEESHLEYLSLHQRHTPDRSRKISLTPAGDRSSSASKSVRVEEQPVSILMRGVATGASWQGQPQMQRVHRYARAENDQPPQSSQARLAAAGPGNTDTSVQGQRRSDSSAHVAMWEKWKTCERSAERWRGKYVAQQQQVKVLQARLASARAVVQRLQQEKRLLLDRDRDDRITSDTISTSREILVGPTTSDREGPSESFYGAPHMSPGALLARVQAQQRRIAALELASKGNGTLIMEYERLLAQNTQLKKINLKLESQVLETQLFAGNTTATALKDDTEIKHLRSYVEMLKVENAELRMGVGCVGCGGCATSARTAVTECGGARIEDLQRTVLTLRGLVAKLQAENKHLRLQKRNRSELHCPAEKDEVLPDDLLRTENGQLKKSLLEKESLLDRSGDVMRRAARREEELLQKISILESMLESSHQTTSQDSTVVR